MSGSRWRGPPGSSRCSRRWRSGATAGRCSGTEASRLPGWAPKIPPLGHLQDGRAGQLPLREVDECPVGFLERIRPGGGLDADAGGDGEELLPVRPGIRGDRAQTLLLEEIPVVIQ